MRTRLLALLVIALGASGLVRAATPAAPGVPAPPHPHHAGGGTERPRSDLGASATFDGRGRLWSVSVDGGHVMLRVSPRADGHWLPPMPVNIEPEPIAADGDNRPKIAAGPGNRLYVSWTRPLAKPYTGEVRFAALAVEDALAASSPSAASAPPPAVSRLAAPRTVHADRQEITHRFDALAVTPQGTVVVAWIDKRDQVAAKAAGADYRGAAVYFTASADGGATFNGDHRLAEHSCECCRIALRPLADGRLAALWRHVFAPDVRDHALAKFTPDGQVDAPVRATADEWHLEACPHHGPALTEDGQGRLHAVWFTQGEARRGVFYGRLGEQGMEAIRAVGDGAAAHADLAADGQRLAIAWKAFDGEATRLHALRSDDGGNSWRELALTATAGPSGQPQVLVRGGRFFVFWHTREAPLQVVALP